MGTLKYFPVTLRNVSEIPARIELRCTSKILSCPVGELVIGPKQRLEIKIEIMPRKVNLDYQKIINVLNLLNRDNDRTIEVSSSNIDHQLVTFHSLFYRISSAQSSDYVQFGSIFLNSWNVRTFVIENISEKELLLNLSSSIPEDIKLYIPTPLSNEGYVSNSFQMHDRKQDLLQKIENRRRLLRDPSHNVTKSTENVQQIQYKDDHLESETLEKTLDSASPYLDLALPPKVYGSVKTYTPTFIKHVTPKMNYLNDSLEPRRSQSSRGHSTRTNANGSRDSVEKFLKSIQLSLIESTKTLHMSEEKLVRSQQHIKQEFLRLVSEKGLISVSDLKIAPGAHIGVIVGFNPKAINFKLAPVNAIELGKIQKA